MERPYTVLQGEPPYQVKSSKRRLELAVAEVKGTCVVFMTATITF